MIEPDPAFDEPPCELCPHIAKCRGRLIGAKRIGQLACERFADFVMVGGRHWRGIEAREPSAKIYAEVFGLLPRPRGRPRGAPNKKGPYVVAV
jgi:hypothetical protein